MRNGSSRSALRNRPDAAYRPAARTVADKIAEVLPAERRGQGQQPPLYVSGWGANPPAKLDLKRLRSAIREQEKLKIVYDGGTGRRRPRTIRPIALLYYIESIVLAAWCERRRDFRHFRADRILACKPTGSYFRGEGDVLRERWQRQHRLP